MFLCDTPLLFLNFQTRVFALILQDATIEQNTWAKKFREFLRSKDLTEHEIFLNFLVLTQALVNADKQVYITDHFHNYILNCFVSSPLNLVLLRTTHHPTNYEISLFICHSF
jgi:thiaminase